MSRRGFIYVASLGVVIFITLASASLLIRSVSDVNLSERSRSLSAALHLAEAGLDEAITVFRNPYTNDWNTWLGAGPTEMSGGTYQTTVIQDGSLRQVQVTGVSVDGSGAMYASRSIEAILRRSIPPNLYDNAIYAAGYLDFRGDAYTVGGEVLTANPSLIDHPENIVCDTPPCVTQDATAAPLPNLSYAELYQIAQSQGNVYTPERLEEIQHHQAAFPTSFCYSPPTDPNDPSTCTPNINYIEGDLVLNGDIGIIGGLFVVVGNVLTDPAAQEDTTINGTGEVQGVIYTRGDFRVNGGGNGLNVDGGVLAGDVARLNGAVTVQYNAVYMNAVKNLHIDPEVQLLMWHECPPSGCGG